ncbi:MAG TPA: roadblock/LC7 domain-containing protein [Streptosporangiaceae bacterium]|jgi:predicted regulator of Ras-like GTPase activity (Roadblock/LC7/MglB family)
MSTPHDLGWMLESLRSDTPGVQHVLVLSTDGLKASYSAGLTADDADQLAAIASGFQSLGLAAAAHFGSGAGWARNLVEYPGGMLLIIPAGPGSQLAVVAAEDADIDLIGTHMAGLVERIGTHLATPPRDTPLSETANPPS